MCKILWKNYSVQNTVKDVYNYTKTETQIAWGETQTAWGETQIAWRETQIGQTPNVSGTRLYIFIS